MIVNNERDKYLLWEYRQNEIDAMSEQEKEAAFSEMKQLEKEHAYIADCERQLMKTCPQPVDPINF